MHILAFLRLHRASRKARQLDELLRVLAEREVDGDPDLCPDALRAVRDLV